MDKDADLPALISSPGLSTQREATPLDATLLAAQAKELGFDHAFYQAQIYPPMTRPTVVLVTQGPLGWTEAVEGQGLSELDPWIRHAQAQASPWLWTAESQPSPAAFWREAHRHGLRHGCTLPLRSEHGVIGVVTYTRSEGPVTQAEFEAKAPALRGHSQRWHEAQLKRHLPHLFHRPDSRLSERERTILRWTADGKTSAEIADILGLTKRTINFHVGKATLKLNATNKTQAALKAALLGLLY